MSSWLARLDRESGSRWFLNLILLLVSAGCATSPETNEGGNVDTLQVTSSAFSDLGTWVHWVLYDLSPDLESLGEAAPEGDGRAHPGAGPVDGNLQPVDLGEFAKRFAYSSLGALTRKGVAAVHEQHLAPDHVSGGGA
jgi:hypothetical protein